MTLFIFCAVLAVVAADSDTTLWKEYSLTNLPTAGSAVVLRERDDLRGSVDFQALENNFRTLSDLARAASQGSTDFGDSTLQTHVQALANDVTGLIGKSRTTVSGFKTTTDSALRQLTVAFGYLGSDDSENALEALQRVSELAKSMATQSEELHKESETDGKGAQNVLEEVTAAKGRAQQNKVALEEKRNQLEISKRKMEELMNSAQQAEMRAQQMAKEAEEAAARARRKRKKKKKGLFGKIKHGLGKLVGHDDTKKYKERERVAREEQRVFNEQRQAHHNEYVRAQTEIGQLKAAISSVHFDTQQAVNAIDALHKLTTTFKSLSSTTLNVVGVWEKLQAHCENLQESLIKKNLEMAADDSAADRKAEWSSPYFESEAIHLYSQWLALQEESSAYLQLKAKHDEL